jgi:hypothetical protein
MRRAGDAAEPDGAVVDQVRVQAVQRAVGTVVGVEGEIHVARVGLGAVDDEEAGRERRPLVGDGTSLAEPGSGVLPARAPVPGEAVQAGQAFPLSFPVAAEEFRGVARVFRRNAESITGMEQV